MSLQNEKTENDLSSPHSKFDIFGHQLLPVVKIYGLSVCVG